MSFHPGVVRTNFGTGKVTRFFYRYLPFLVTPEKAGALLVWLATTPIAELTNGGYYIGHKVTAAGEDGGRPGGRRQVVGRQRQGGRRVRGAGSLGP